MIGAAYYNEIDEYAAAWLRNLIAAGRIAPGEVDTRSIEDVHPADLQDFAQCHFFAGIGVWSYALRRAGWPDDRPVWTGSCPCQPFSAAGQGAGFADERHLWPHFFHLIGERRPAVVLGEQVASKDADPWIDLVQDDLEGLGYRVGAIPFPSAGVGAPHIRDRLYWAAASGNRRNMVSGRTVAQRLADADKRQRGSRRAGSGEAHRAHSQPAGLRAVDGMAYPNGGNASAEREQRSGEQRQQSQDGGCGVVALGHLGDASCARLAQRLGVAGVSGGAIGGNEGEAAVGTGIHAVAGPGPTNGYWRDADWLSCRDGKWRPVEPGTFPLAHGAPARVGRLRAYGNAINAEAARVFIESVMEIV